ncbi:sugar phosphate isomerase/epimerase family protein [Paenibacillus arenilitoris]|uniref:Sugar phosphate isomerase/epimerase n=1 Tax=Paenibacillus arenilitoris TaxID=2772299 RepID=A0A927CGR2_9BACL|nr:sugar phosphate isomerase/epimerase family protein [Paenibacillus arenilitoris]MBD2867794.1 sugar phosphate isomerase/epimerase [Paenibacillus arenilitoris]
MKFSVFTVMLPDCSLETTADLLRKYGYQGVEWRFTRVDPAKRGDKPSFWGNNLSTVDASSSEEELLSIKRLTDETGLAVPNLAAYIQAGDLDATEKAMKAAKLLGAPSIRVGVPGYDRSRSYADLLKEGRAYLNGVQELGKAYGVKGLIEVHFGNIAPSASAARRLVDGFDPDLIGVIYDPGNMVYEGFEQYKLGLEALGEYLGHVHIKNAAWVRTDAPQPAAGEESAPHGPLWKASWSPVAEGVVHWPQVIADLKAIGYDGWLSFEDFSGSAPSEALLRDNIAYIRSLLQAAR